MWCRRSIWRLSSVRYWAPAKKSYTSFEIERGAAICASDCISNAVRTGFSSVTVSQRQAGSEDDCNHPSIRMCFRSVRSTDLQVFSRQYAGEASQESYTEEVDEINTKFVEARDDIEMALESKETVYFDAEAETARASVKAVLDKYDALLARLDERNRGVIQRSMGLKMEQLKAELKQLELD